jgi:DNA-directed RNA polymerase specialized sigma24 family protein
LAVPTENELLHRARQGDAAAFEALIRRHDKHLYRVARSVLLDDQEAEDAVQETYVRVLIGLRDFRAGALCSISTCCMLRRNACDGRSIRLR